MRYFICWNLTRRYDKMMKEERRGKISNTLNRKTTKWISNEFKNSRTKTSCYHRNLTDHQQFHFFEKKIEKNFDDKMNEWYIRWFENLLVQKCFYLLRCIRQSARIIDLSYISIPNQGILWKFIQKWWTEVKRIVKIHKSMNISVNHSLSSRYQAWWAQRLSTNCNTYE